MGKIILYIFLCAVSLLGQHMSLSGVEMIKHYEGFRAKPYLCPAGVLTIGYGETKGVKWGMTITEPDALKLLITSIDGYVQPMNRKLTRNLPLYQRDAGGSVAYNRGSLTPEMYYAINTNNTPRVVRLFKERNYGMVRGIKKVIPGLIVRREDETSLYSKGTIEKKWYLDWKKKTGFTY